MDNEFRDHLLLTLAGFFVLIGSIVMACALFEFSFGGILSGLFLLSVAGVCYTMTGKAFFPNNNLK